MYPIGKDKTSLRAREINTGDASKSLFRINRSTQGNPIQNIGMPSRKISIENKHTGILKVSRV